MIEHRGLYFCDGEVRMIETLEQERVTKNAPDFDGKPTFQFRKFARSFPFIRNFRTAIDIGAHIGLWSRVFSRMFERVIAFEPIPAHRECFDRNIRPEDRARIRLVSTALGAEHGEASLVWKARNTGITYTLPPAGVADLKQGTEIVVAPMAPLDAFALTNVDYIKIDVEGFELEVVRGAERTIRECKPGIILEQKPRNAERYGRSQHDACMLLRTWGMQLEFDHGGDHFMRWP